MDFQGSRGSNASPFCNSSTEIPSGEITNAMRPSRGGRLITIPAFSNASHLAYMSSTANARCPIDRDGGANVSVSPVASSGQLYVISISGAPWHDAMNTNVNLPFCDSFRRVSTRPRAEKNAIVASRLDARTMVCKNVTSPSLGNEWYVSAGR